MQHYHELLLLMCFLPLSSIYGLISASEVKILESPKSGSGIFANSLGRGSFELELLSFSGKIDDFDFNGNCRVHKIKFQHQVFTGEVQFSDKIRKCAFTLKLRLQNGNDYQRTFLYFASK